MEQPATAPMAPEGDPVAAYRRHMSDLLAGFCLIGVLAQLLAVFTASASLRDSVCIGGGCLMLIGASRWLRGLSLNIDITVMFVLGLTTIEGLFYLNGGWDGSHLYPLLWTFSLVSCAGLYGFWALTMTVIGAGCIVAIGGKLCCPDDTFGIGADQTWARVASTCTWWCIALIGAGITGSRVIRLAQATADARRAVLSAKAKEHAWLSEAEGLRLAAATERAQALTGLARTFDAQVRSVGSAVAATSVAINVWASALSKAAAVTGEGVSRAAALSVAVAADVGMMAHGAGPVRRQLDARAWAGGRGGPRGQCRNGSGRSQRHGADRADGRHGTGGPGNFAYRHDRKTDQPVGAETPRSSRRARGQPAPALPWLLRK